MHRDVGTHIIFLIMMISAGLLYSFLFTAFIGYLGEDIISFISNG